MTDKVIHLYPEQVVRRLDVYIQKIGFLKYTIYYAYINCYGETIKESSETGYPWDIQAKLDNSIGWVRHEYCLTDRNIVVYNYTNKKFKKLIDI